MPAPQIPGAIVGGGSRSVGEQILLSLVGALPSAAFQGIEMVQQGRQRSAAEDAALALIQSQVGTSPLAANFQQSLGPTGPTGDQRRMAVPLADQLTTESGLASQRLGREATSLGMSQTRQQMGHADAAAAFDEIMRPLQEELSVLQIDGQRLLNEGRAQELQNLQAQAADRLGAANTAGVQFAEGVLRQRESVALDVARALSDPTGANFPTVLAAMRRLYVGDLDAASLGLEYSRIALGGGSVSDLTAQLAVDPVEALAFQMGIPGERVDAIEEQIAEGVDLREIWHKTVLEVQRAVTDGTITEEAAGEELARLVPLFTAYGVRVSPEGERPARFVPPESLRPAATRSFLSRFTAPGTTGSGDALLRSLLP